MKYVKVDYKYKLVEIEIFELNKTPAPVYGEIYASPNLSIFGDKLNPYRAEMILQPGYGSDGPSGLTIDTKSSIPGAFGHDAGYEMLRKGLLSPFDAWREYFDNHLGIWCKEAGMWQWRADMWVKAVKAMGFNAAYKKRKIFEAPRWTTQD